MRLVNSTVEMNKTTYVPDITLTIVISAEQLELINQLMGVSQKDTEQALGQGLLRQLANDAVCSKFFNASLIK